MWGRGSPCLALEPLEGRGVVRERLGQELEGDVTPELQVPGPKHLAHASRSQGSEDLVVPEASARREGHRVSGPRES